MRLHIFLFLVVVYTIGKARGLVGLARLGFPRLAFLFFFSFLSQDSAMVYIGDCHSVWYALVQQDTVWIVTRTSTGIFLCSFWILFWNINV